MLTANQCAIMRQ